MKFTKNEYNSFKGCIIGGAIGDCIGGYFENQQNIQFDTNLNYDWRISDDTQLTLATCEAIIEAKGQIKPEFIAKRFVYWFNNHKITGVGSSTLKALRDLQFGQHWALAGRQGEYAAGNGAAMRIAPLAFVEYDRQVINDVCRITHRNDEAYLGALSVALSIKYFKTNSNLDGVLEYIIENIADTKIRDRYIEINAEKKHSVIEEIAKKYGSSGYVIESVPLAVFAAQKIDKLDLETIFQQIVQCGGDTDTVCSIAGQIIGSRIGYSAIPQRLLSKLEGVGEFELINTILNDWNNQVIKNG